MNSAGSFRLLRARYFLFALPAFAGFFLMYAFPFARSVWYSFIDSVFTKNFVFLGNYAEVAGNRFYRLAVKNTLFFTLAGFVSLMLLSLLFSFLLSEARRKSSLIEAALLAPMFLPTASAVFFWRLPFASPAFINFAREHLYASGVLAALPVFLMFLWKNAGFNMVILCAAISGVSREISESASLDGAGRVRRFIGVTLPYITPGVVFASLLSVSGTLKIFREAYLYYATDYPPDAVYTLQFYMNNHFRKLNYQYLTAGSIMFTAAVAALLLVFVWWEARRSEKTY
ncbi:MAG: sugar ABC transporter permease [Defluviitaleaceae bacterium]|nr:sugar ABC transporter permease [Defluviitaleaceae bacterium]